MVRPSLALIVTLLSLWAGCADEPAPLTQAPQTPPVMPLAPVEPLAQGGQVSMRAQPQLKLKWLGLSLTSGALWMWDQDGALYRQGPDGEAKLMASLSERDGYTQLWSVAELEQDKALISTDAGLVVVEPGLAQVSPLAGLLGNWPVEAMLSDGARQWFSSQRGVELYEDGRLKQLELEAGPKALAFGPKVDGVPSLWVGSAQGVFAVLPGEDMASEGVTMYRSLSDAKVESLHSSDLGSTLWMRSSAGAMWMRDSKGQWSRLKSEAKIVEAKANPSSPDVWMRDEGGQVYHWSGRSLTPIKDVSWAELAAVDAAGRLVLAGEEGLTLIDRRYRVSVQTPSAPLTQLAQATIEVTFDELVKQLEATIDEQPIALEPSARQLELDPASLGPGRHRLKVVVTYADGQKAVTTSSFEVGAFDYTWAAHIEPLFKAKCSMCHAVRSHRELHTSQKWQDDFTNISDQVERGLMPLPPFERLNAAELRMLKLWKEGGYR